MSDALVALARTTRSYLQAELGTAWQARREDPFRESAGLEGHWLGAFAQPAVFLNTVSATEVTIDAQCNGTARDEYGHAKIVGLLATPDRLTFEKTYNGSTFIYEGGRHGPAITGYWRSKSMPSFAGIFSLTRSDCMTEESAEQIRASIERRARTKMRNFFRIASVPGSLGLVVLFAVIGPIWAVAAGAVFGFFFVRSKRALTAKVTLLRNALDAGGA